MHVGTRIRAQRLALGLSQQQLAGRELTPSFISAVELGKVGPSRETLELLASRLKRPVSDFLTGSQEATPLSQALLRTAEHESGLGNHDTAVTAARHAVQVAETSSVPDQFRARTALVRVLKASGPQGHHPQGARGRGDRSAVFSAGS